MKNDLSSHKLSVEDATKLALGRPLQRLLALNWCKSKNDDGDDDDDIRPKQLTSHLKQCKL